MKISPTMQVSRRQFLKLSASGIGATSLTALGFAPDRVLADVREFKLAHTSQTRNTCPYCSVSCGVIMYGLGDKSKNAKSKIIHIEGDPDNPVNRGTLCPKGAGLLDFVNSPSRLRYPEYRAPGASEFKRVTWDWALERIARLMKEDRDKNFVEKNAEGVTVNRWPTFGMLAASASSNETGYITHKTFRAMGVVAMDNQARV
jgi:formate dehydrogenase major subunit